jgi:RimJ/RimL family protein N-acetyltransferase
MPGDRVILTTERLLLRELTMDDVDGLLDIFGDPIAMAFYRSTRDREQTAEWIEWARLSYAEHGFGLWAVVRGEDGRFLGDCGPMLQPIEGELVPEIGYHVVRSEWGRGYASEAAIASRDWLWEHTDFERICSIVDQENLASRRVAERVHQAMRLFTWEKEPDHELCLYESRREPEA